MRRSFKYRLYPNANQRRELGIALETHRRLYNDNLAMRVAAWECDRVSVGFYFQSWCFTSAKRENPYYARINSASAEQTLRRLDQSYQNFFARGGFPRFKGRDGFSSFLFKKGNGARLIGDKLRVQHIGVIKVKMHRPHEGEIKTITLHFGGDHWHVILSCDLGEQTIPKSSNPPVGIDMGLESFLTTSDGEHEPNPRLQKAELPRLRRLSRSIARKKWGGKNRCKAVRRVRRLHRRVRNLRHDHRHKTALKLVRRYGLIALERLNVQGMVRNRRLARSISDAGWSGFGCVLKAKAESAGVEVVEVDPRGTSQACSACGQIVVKDLSQRQHKCPCGCSLHRDVNAARNILARGLARTEPAGRNVGSHRVSREVTIKSQVTSTGEQP